MEEALRRIALTKGTRPLYLVPLARFVGHLVYGHESRELATCGGRRYWVTDVSGGDLRRWDEVIENLKCLQAGRTDLLNLVDLEWEY